MHTHAHACKHTFRLVDTLDLNLPPFPLLSICLPGLMKMTNNLLVASSYETFSFIQASKF